MSIIINGKYLLAPDGLKKDWGLEIEGSRIVKACPNDKLPVAHGCQVIDARDKIVAPGFVNGHMHMYGVLSHGITANALVTEFSSFLEDFWWPYVEDRIDHDLVASTAKWACVEMIRSGITSFTDVLEGPNSIPGALDIEAEVIGRSGLRGFVSFEACQRKSEANAQAGLKENTEFIKANNKKDRLVKGDTAIYDKLNVSAEVKDKIFSGNLLKFLGKA